MPVSYQKNIKKHYVYCKMEGVGVVSEVLDYIDEIAADPELDAPFFEFVDFTTATKLEFGYYESNQIMQKYFRLRDEKGYLGTIFITDSDHTRGMANMYQSAGEQRGLRILIAGSLEEAESMIKMYFKIDGDNPHSDDEPDP